MKKIITILFLLSFAAPLLAATVGGPEIGIPEESFYLKDEAVNRTLDRYEYHKNIKGSFEIEVIGEKELTSAAEVSNAKLEGQNYMFKVSQNFYNILEPYVKIGTSNLKVKWDQNSQSATVESNPSFMWGLGLKAKLYEFERYGVKLTFDTQYRSFDLGVDKAELSGSSAPPKGETFVITEWQTSLLASKKIVIPVRMRDYYLVPYAGLTLSWTDVKVDFTNSSTGQLFSTYDASDENVVGLVFGCDVMPSLLSWYLINVELRLINETAFTLGGTAKF